MNVEDSISELWGEQLRESLRPSFLGPTSPSVGGYGFDRDYDTGAEFSLASFQA